MEFLDAPGTIRLVGSIIAIAVLLAVRWLIARVLIRMLDDLENRRRWLVLVRNIVLLLSFLTLVVIWADELRTFVISIVALAAAIAISAKEIIMCLTGALVRASRPSFRLGDRIEVGGVRGDVIDHRLLTTTLLEVGSGHARTGKAVVLPNSIFLSAQVINETTGTVYLVHSINVRLEKGADVGEAEETLLAIGQDITAEFVEPARAEFHERSERHGLLLPKVDPQTAITLDGDQAMITLRVPVPGRQKGSIEQAILHRWLDDTKSVVDPES